MIDYKKYTNIDLIEFEKEIFGDNLDNGKTFKDYLIEQGAWIINGKYKDGAVRNPTKYIMLNEKWECLQMLRYKREKAKQHEQEDNKNIDKQRLAGKMSVEPDIKECPTCNELKESSPTPDGDEVCPNCGDNEMMDYEPISKTEKPYTHDIGCEIQHTGKCNCKDKNYEQPDLTEDQKETLKTIPF